MFFIAINNKKVGFGKDIRFTVPAHLKIQKGV